MAPMSASKLTTRPVPGRSRDMLIEQGVHPVLAAIYASRGVRSRDELERELGALLPLDMLLHADDAAVLLADAIRDKKRLLIVADYDCDGATACAVGMRALRAFGANVGYLVPDRFKLGYGLTPELSRMAANSAAGKPDILITVDNGIASVEGVAEANRLGMQVLVTDHHLPGATLPDAAAIVNPNQPGCKFPSKSIAGVGLMFYVMLALRAELRKRSHFADRAEPNLAELLDLVALGTVADVVKLDANNRILVTQGIKRIRAGRMQAGLKALFSAAGRESARASGFDLGFMLGPRLNAAGRLADMSLGVECLVTDDPGRALNIARELDALNRERRGIEGDMQAQAETLLRDFVAADNASVCVYDPAWHQGVIGILASRVKDKLHRPTIAFARGENGELKGSGRSISALHLRDALDLVTKREPGILIRFGGHAAAAGLTLLETDYARFTECFETVVREMVGPAQLVRTIETDGTLPATDLNLDLAQQLDQEVWGQGFPQPLFCDEFKVTSQRVVGEKHLKLKLLRGARAIDGVRFNVAEPCPAKVRAAYRLSINDYNGVRSVQVIVEDWEALA
jgi:single-stranded-DNA-specific exonuclease